MYQEKLSKLFLSHFPSQSLPLFCVCVIVLILWGVKIIFTVELDAVSQDSV